MAISKRTAVALAVLCASVAWLYWDVFTWLIDDWNLDGDYSHGFAIIPLALYLVWERRDELRRMPVTPALSGLWLVALSFLLLAAGTLGAETFVTRVSLVVLVAGAIVFLFGWSYLRQLAFPVAFLLLMIPIPSILANRVTIPLQFIASRFGETMLSAAGVPVLREGNVILLPAMTLYVAEACSGIRSLMSLFTLGVLYGYFAESRTWMRIVLCIATVPIAIAANGLRVAGTGFAAHWYGAGAAEGFFHTFSGWLVFLAAAVLLTIFHRAAQWLVPGTTGKAAPAESTV
jgi:exosortase